MTLENEASVNRFPVRAEEPPPANMMSMYTLLNRNIDTLLASIGKHGGIPDYKYLIKEFRNTDVSRDDKFQNIYRSYWRMGAARLCDSFCKTYFEYLEELKAFDCVDVQRIAVRLYSVPANGRGERKLHFSFSTKMAHMLQPNRPVYDSLVAQFYFLPEEEGTFDGKLKTLLSSYEFLIAEYERVTREGLLLPAIDAFRARFDGDRALTEAKIIDTLIWRFAAMLNDGGLKGGIIRYC
jgi:hypothetical protein